MNLIGPSLLLCLVLGADGPPAPKLPLGKDTTYVTGPLDKDGYIDYEAALNDRLGAGVAPEKNANVLLWKALGPMPGATACLPSSSRRLGIHEPPKDGSYFIPLGRFVTDQLKLGRSESDAAYDQQNRAGERPWAAKDYPRIAAWLEANEKPLALVVEATKQPDYYNPLVSRPTEKKPCSLENVLLPGVQKCRELAAALTARAMLRVEEGKYDGAWQDLLACHRLGRLIARGGTLIETLVGVAIDTLASNADVAYVANADLTAPRIEDRLKELQRLPHMPSIADKIDLMERFEHLQFVQFLRRGGEGMLEAATGGPAAPMPGPDGEKALAAIDWAPVLRDCNRWYDRVSAVMRSNDHGYRNRQLRRIDKDVAEQNRRTNEPAGLAEILLGPPGKTVSKAISKSINDTMIGLMTDVWVKVADAQDRDEQVRRNVQVAFALAAYHRDHGDYPAKLGDLAPKYLAAVPDDLFSGKALVYRPTEKGYLFYSVGADGKDEGGRSFNDDPAGDDLPVSMPLPELKGKR